ncbi:MAG: hypothetical protein IT449_04605 [Phycisphaerales bacterium]|nr:hypothetical protein [Phycisphaerales bacterium]
MRLTLGPLTMTESRLVPNAARLTDALARFIHGSGGCQTSGFATFLTLEHGFTRGTGGIAGGFARGA